MKALDTALHNQIVELCDQGEAYEDEAEWEDALALYTQAYDLLPEPKTQYEPSTFLLSAMADVHFQLGEYQTALDQLTLVMHSPDAIGNPYLHFLRGQVLFEMNALEQAFAEFKTVYQLDGLEIFEDDDPKYLHFLNEQLNETP